jgi:hypothetical protein
MVVAVATSITFSQANNGPARPHAQLMRTQKPAPRPLDIIPHPPRGRPPRRAPLAHLRLLILVAPEPPPKDAEQANDDEQPHDGTHKHEQPQHTRAHPLIDAVDNGRNDVPRRPLAATLIPLVPEHGTGAPRRAISRHDVGAHNLVQGSRVGGADDGAAQQHELQRGLRGAVELDGQRARGRGVRAGLDDVEADDEGGRVGDAVQRVAVREAEDGDRGIVGEGEGRGCGWWGGAVEGNLGGADAREVRGRG